MDVDQVIPANVKVDNKMSAEDLCDPCKLIEKHSSATHYCEQCEEDLCEDCFTGHQTRKATKLHKPITMLQKQMRDLILCEPCETIKKYIEAVMFCEECEEYLCSECISTHKMGKATRKHMPIEITSMKEHSSQSDEIRKLCEPCEIISKRQIATKYCTECEELLCERCTDVHRSSKFTKSHVPIHVSLMYNVAHAVPSSILCEPCQYQNLESVAAKVCVECDENLCDACVQIHSVQKATKKHQIKDVVEKQSSVQNCELCLLRNAHEPANLYCEICEERLCEPCGQQHRSQKATKLHNLVQLKDKPVINKSYMCEPCSCVEISKTAIKWCKECKEFLCDTCSARHRLQKATKEHVLNDPDTALITVCDPCSEAEKHIPADNHCTICNENLCKECTNLHKFQKATKTHVVIGIIDVSETYHSENQGLHVDSPSKAHIDQDVPGKPVACDIRADSLTLSLDSSAAFGDNAYIQDVPGKPVASDIYADSLTLSWDPSDAFGDNAYYQVTYKDVNNAGRWKFHPKEHTRATAVLNDMKSNTKFIFRVRVIYEDGEGPYSPSSDEIWTAMSPASRIVEFANVVEKGPPSKHALPITETRNARNVSAKTKKFEIGSPPAVIDKEKTIMLVGATGTGKSTLVDGFVNYYLGVNWNDPFRFTIIDLEQDEKDKLKNQALSQTEWITCYSINPEQGSRLRYRLNIIDTPGFGDTRGLERDQEIVEQIRQLFSDTGPKGISCIDAVCFLVKAPDARLTSVQRYIFQSIMSLFGKDIESNICSLVTFADGIDPPVLAALNESGLPFGKSFTFNNSGLFANNMNISISSLSPMFWEMGIKSFREFFKHINQVQNRSLQLTKDVLDERFRMEAVVRNLQPQLDAGLATVNQLKQEMKIFEDHKSQIKDNAKFAYYVDELQLKKKELLPGMHTTTCTYCHFTCHENCAFANDDQKARCCAMGDDGKCKICPEKCHWQKHANTKYIIEYVTIKVKKTYADMQKKYQEASGKVPDQEQLLEKMGNDLDDLCDAIEDMMFVVKSCNERLKDIALRPNPLSMTDHIDLMIESEKLEKKPDYNKRIKVLAEFRKRAHITLDAEVFNKDARSTLGAVMKGGQKVREKDVRTLLSRIKSFFG